MVNKCVAFGCSSGYHTNSEKVSTFSFPLEKYNLFEKRVKFANRKNSLLSIKHFGEKLILKRKRNKVNQSLHLIPTKPFRKKSLFSVEEK